MRGEMRVREYIRNKIIDAGDQYRGVRRMPSDLYRTEEDRRLNGTRRQIQQDNGTEKRQVALEEGKEIGKVHQEDREKEHNIGRTVE